MVRLPSSKRGVAAFAFVALALAASVGTAPAAQQIGSVPDDVATAPMSRPDVPDAKAGRTDARTIDVTDASQCRWLMRNPGRTVMITQVGTSDHAGVLRTLPHVYPFTSGMDAVSAFSLCEMPREPGLTVLTHPPAG